VVATGGSGALAPLVGVAKALQDSGTEVSVYSVCPGSALFGFPLGGGMPPDEVAELTASPRAVKVARSAPRDALTRASISRATGYLTARWPLMSSPTTRSCPTE